MTEHRREKLKNRITPVQLYQLTPRTNCGECGFMSCLAFATQVVVGQGKIESCPYLDKTKLKTFKKRLNQQLSDGIGVKRESFQKALDFLRKEIKKSDLETIAESLGAEPFVAHGRSALKLDYLGKIIVVTYDDIYCPEGIEIDPWEKIFIYNYVIGGATEPSGKWVGMESLPNSISKIRSLKEHCEEPLARSFAGKTDLLTKVVEKEGGKIPEIDAMVDFVADFTILPKLTIRVQWWDEEPEEGFEAKTKFLFDARVLETLDIESLLFACQQLTDRLIAAVRPLTDETQEKNA